MKEIFATFYKEQQTRRLYLIIVTDKFRVRLLRGNKNVNQWRRNGRAEILASTSTCRVVVLFRWLVMQVTRVTASIDFLPDRFRRIRADNWVSAIERTNRQGIGPRKRTSEKLGIHFPLFHRPYSSSRFLRPRSAIYLRSLSTWRNMIAMSKRENE